MDIVDPWREDDGWEFTPEKNGCTPDTVNWCNHDEIDQIINPINKGVYRTDFADSRTIYEKAVTGGLP